jgi:crotonobetainyl-CoA:carnitine CoA-transferase CaiB-like acyl-CoA transferase
MMRGRPPAVGCAAVAGDDRRQAHEDELERRIAEWTREWDAEALMVALQGVSSGS